MTPEIFRSDAKTIVDVMFENKIFKETFTRDDMNGIEDMLQFMMQSKFDSYTKAEKLFDKINQVKK